MLRTLDHELEHEQVRMVRGERSGITIIVAVHSTALGCAIGGCRLRCYPSWRDGLDDALRLSAAMTDKCSLAGIDHGGGKTVAILPADPLARTLRAALMLDIADVIGSFRGGYLAGPDIGSGPDDMLIIHQRTGYAFCRPTSAGGSGDTAGATARGVLAALLAGAEHVFGTRSLAGCRIGIIGLGSVGAQLARLLHERGADLSVTDIDDQRRADGVAVGARWCGPLDILTAELDILIPAATGGLLTLDVAHGLRCRLIVGPANNQLATDEVADVLQRRGIVWVPDVIASAGGVIHAINIEQHGLTHEQVLPRIDAIGDTVARLLTEAARSSQSPLTLARRRAAEGIRHGNLAWAPTASRGPGPPAQPRSGCGRRAW